MFADSAERNQRVPNIGDLQKKYYGHASSLQLQIIQKFYCKFRIFIISILLSYFLYGWLQSETLQHVVSSCKSYLDEGRYTWRHISVLLFLASTFSSLKQCTVYADLPSFLSPCLITGDSLRPDLLLLIDEKILYILELTLGFETNIQNNSDRKAAKYSSLINDLCLSYSKVVFVNLSMGAIGVMGSSCNSLLSLLPELHFDKKITKRIIMKAMNISIRSSYYIFCRQNKPWTNPELLTI